MKNLFWQIKTWIKFQYRRYKDRCLICNTKLVPYKANYLPFAAHPLANLADDICRDCQKTMIHAMNYSMSMKRIVQ